MDVSTACMNSREMFLKPILLGKLAGTYVARVRPLVAVAQHVTLYGRRLQVGLRKKYTSISYVVHSILLMLSTFARQE